MASTQSKIVIDATGAKQQISSHIYGHFAEHLGRCVYEGLWVGEDSAIPNTRGFRNDVVAALCNMHIPNLRWPGGCFADTYHWMDGIGPREKRPSMVNVHWGGTTENNHCGTHEFLDLCAQLGTEPYICGNVGSGTVKEMSEWLEYLTHPGPSPMADLRKKNGREKPWHIKYWAVGNENWGCGGNMRAEYYSDLLRQYGSYCRNLSGEKLFKIACGHEDDWNRILLKNAHSHFDGLSIHYYTIPGDWTKKGSSTDFDETIWHTTLRKAGAIEEFISRTAKIMDEVDPQRRIGIIMDEWGTWYDVEPGTNPGFLYQQNTMRDALVAGLSLNIFNKHADRVHMANIAQTVNVLQAMVLTEGARMLLTPTYHVFEMYKVHQNATLLNSTIDNPTYQMDKETIDQISVSASLDAQGKVHISLCNLHHDMASDITASLKGIDLKTITGRILTGSMHAMNTFDKPSEVQPTVFNEATLQNGLITLNLPARSVVMLELS